MIELTLPGEPKALQRHRTSVKNGKQRQFDAQKKKKMMDRNILYVKMYQQGDRLNDNYIKNMSMVVNLYFYFYRPPILRSYNEQELNAVTHNRKPDIDNCIKYILDVGNNLFWHDDCQVTEIYAKKMWSKTPRTEISIEYNNII